ncbi:hypothetical protein DIC66_03120 [Rhodoferax lacus]|uniref:Type II secretion system protein H n=1 Tax=Rhodoferax lacus TaxID=2184758 RepID=A0A3E1RHK7_9BURK|nr:GspH/FimT family pseudopilin [Rhodoferax lacus]RFO98876.1 hypothetical protein DIC66_03120 [Rhodoferax lacus]
MQTKLYQPKTRYRQGLTAVEMLVVLVIAGILAALATPSLVSMANTLRQKSAINMLASDLNLARAEAVKRNARVLVCARSATDATDANDTGCATSSPSWASGWLVCVDTTSDGTDNCDAATATIPNPLYVRAPLATQLTLSAHNGAATYGVRFNANGTQGGAGAMAATLTVGGTWSGAVDKTLTVAATGSVQAH